MCRTAAAVPLSRRSSELTKMGGILQILFANLIIIMDFLCDDNNNNGKCRPHWSLLLRSSAMIVSGAGWIVKDGQDVFSGVWRTI